MHLIGKNAQARCDGVEARLQFREQPNEFLGRKFYRRMLEQEVDHFGAPKIIFEIVFAIRVQQFREHRRSGGAFEQSLSKLRRRLGDGIIAQQRFTERLRCFCCRNWLIAFRAKSAKDFLQPDQDRWSDKLRPSRRPSKLNSPTGEIDLEMARLLFGFRATQTAID